MGAEEDQDELLLPWIQAARERLEGRLRAGVLPEDCGPAFPLAAAMLAVEGLERASGAGGAVSFTAGEVSIRTGGTGKNGESLSAQAERLLSPWLGATGFAFQGVRG